MATKCYLCEFASPGRVCAPCLEQCHRLQVTPERLKGMLRSMHHSGNSHDAVLKQAIKVGLLEREEDE